MTDDRPYVEKSGGSFIREKGGKVKRVAGTIEPAGPQPRSAPASTEQPADPAAETSRKGK